MDACTTYSIGFRAPSAQELGTAFLDWLRDSIALEGRYADPSLATSAEPARIGAAHATSDVSRCSPAFAGATPSPSAFWAAICRNPSRASSSSRHRVRSGLRGSARRRHGEAFAWTRARSCYTMPAMCFSTARCNACAASDAGMIKRLANGRHLSRGSARGLERTASPGRGAAAPMVSGWIPPPRLSLPPRALQSCRASASRPLRSTS